MKGSDAAIPSIPESEDEETERGYQCRLLILGA